MSHGRRRDALTILGQWNPNMPEQEAARLLGRGLRHPIDGETAAALLEMLNRMAIHLGLVRLMLDGTIVARANVDPARPGKWIYYTPQDAARLRGDSPAHDDVAAEEWGR